MHHDERCEKNASCKIYPSLTFIVQNAGPPDHRVLGLCLPRLLLLPALDIRLYVWQHRAVIQMLCHSSIQATTHDRQCRVRRHMGQHCRPSMSAINQCQPSSLTLWYTCLRCGHR